MKFLILQNTLNFLDHLSFWIYTKVVCLRNSSFKVQLCMFYHEEKKLKLNQINVRQKSFFTLVESMTHAQLHAVPLLYWFHKY